MGKRTVPTRPRMKIVLNMVFLAFSEIFILEKMFFTFSDIFILDHLKRGIQDQGRVFPRYTTPSMLKITSLTM